MKILFLTNYYPPYEVGGYEQLCRDVAMRMVDRGHTITVLTSDRHIGEGKNLAESNVQRLLRIQPQPDSRLGIAAQFFLTRRRAETYNRRTFHVVVEHFRPDVAFIWNLQGLPQELALDAEAYPDMAVAYWLAGYTPSEPDLFWRYWAQSPGQRAVLEKFKRTLRRIALAQMRREGKPVRPQMRHAAVVSEYMRQKGLVEDTLPTHTEVIYNGVEAESFFRPVPPPDAPQPVTLLVAGRVSPDKGIHVAVEAIGKLAQARAQHDFHLIVAGSGPSDYLKYLQQLAITYGITDLVSFLGWQPRDRMPEIMHTCHILLLPTIHQEPFARVTLEAMAAGMAVVGTLTGGTGEILQHEVTGLACASEDSTDLTHQLGRLLDAPQLRYRLACQGQKTVLAHYTLECMVEQIEALLERAIVEQRTRDNEH